MNKTKDLNINKSYLDTRSDKSMNATEMKIERLGYKVTRSSIVYELMPITSNGTSEHEKIIADFFNTFKLVRSYRTAEMVPPQTLAEKMEEKPTDTTPILTSRIPEKKQRRYAILNEMPEEFTTADIVKYWTDKGFDEKMIYTVTYGDVRQLVKHDKKLVAIKDPKDARTFIYRKVTAESNYEDTLRSLKEGHKVLMGTIQ